ncbi:MAG: carbon-nitrogen hydrolase family protein, partial [Bacillota bacterium]
IREAAAKGANLVIFPELYYQGYYNSIERFHELAESCDGTLYSALSACAQEHNVHVIMGYCEKKDESPGKVYNTLMFVDNMGRRIENYTKVYGWDTEKDIFTDGEKFAVCDTQLGKIGLLICYDIEFPETFRALNMKGAEMVVCCSAWRTFLQHRWNSGLYSGATANLSFVVGCNTVGVNPAYQELCCDSKVIRPCGLTAGVAGNQEQILYCTVDMDEVQRERDSYPIWKDYRYDMFDKSLLEKYF